MLTQAQIANGTFVLHDGDVTVCRSLIKQFNLESFDSDIAIHQSQPNLYLRAHDGDVKFRSLAKNINCHVHSFNGNITYHGKGVGEDFSIKADSQVRTGDGNISIN